MTEGNYYKHERGMDAVILVHNAVRTSAGWLLLVSWHSLSFKGLICTPETFQEHFISHEDAQKWHIYEVPDEQHPA